MDAPPPPTTGRMQVHLVPETGRRSAIPIDQNRLGTACWRCETCYLLVAATELNSIDAARISTASTWIDFLDPRPFRLRAQGAVLH